MLTPNTLPSTTILLVDGDSKILNEVKALFQSEHRVLYARNARAAKPILDQEAVAVLVCNEYLEGENGLQFMGRINKQYPLLQTVLMSEGIDEDLMAVAINEVGVLKYLKKPLQDSQLQKALTDALAHHLQAKEIAFLKANYSKALKEMHGLPYLARRTRQTTRIMLHNINDLTSAASITVAVMLGIFFILGIVILIALYALKSVFGIDLFADGHLSDILGNIISS